MEFTEGLRKVFLAGVGAVASTAENAKELIDDLVEKGELTVAQGRMLNEELKHTAKEKVKEETQGKERRSILDNCILSLLRLFRGVRKDNFYWQDTKAGKNNSG